MLHIKERTDRKLRKIEDEIWKPLLFTDKKYEISNYGRIKSYCYDKQSGRIVKPTSIRGFLFVSLRVNGKSKTYLVHKLTAEYFVAKENEEQNTVIHLDWNKLNNYYKNLQWASKKDSYERMHIRFKEDKKKFGKITTNSKLKPADVKQIKIMLQNGIKQKIIAQLFCVSEMQITRIKKGENWSDVITDN